MKLDELLDEHANLLRNSAPLYNDSRYEMYREWRNKVTLIRRKIVAAAIEESIKEPVPINIWPGNQHDSMLSYELDKAVHEAEKQIQPSWSFGVIKLHMFKAGMNYIINEVNQICRR